MEMSITSQKSGCTIQQWWSYDHVALWHQRDQTDKGTAEQRGFLLCYNTLLCLRRKKKTCPSKHMKKPVSQSNHSI